MIARIFTKRGLQYMPLARFSGSDLRHQFKNEITDEGYSYQNQFHVKPPTEEKIFQLTNILSKVPMQNNKESFNILLNFHLIRFEHKIFLDLISKNLDTNAAVSTSDYIVPPKVHENSIFVYQARTLGNTVRKFRSLESLIIPGALITFTFPVFAIMFAIPTYYFVFNAKFYEMSRRLVIRMDILPHLEMVSVSRVGAFGIVYTKLHRIQDLEYVPFDSVKDNENYLWAIGGHGVDNNLIFKDKQTGEFLYFERTGIWDAKGLEHALLN